jgi:hypothetical protein
MVIEMCGEKQMYRTVRPARTEKELKAAADEAWMRRQMLAEHPFCEMGDRRE